LAGTLPYYPVYPADIQIRRENLGRRKNKKMSFMDLLSEKMNQTAATMGYDQPTPIQTKAIPAVMEGRDIIGQAQTGTGKTAAFAMPILEKIDTSSHEVQALILCPTRELAQQITEAITKMSQHMQDFSLVAVYGGTSMEPQIRKLAAGAQLVVGTPGRVLDHLKRRTMRFFHLTMVTLDEADEMLDMGFREDIEEIISYTSYKRQTLMFSATMPPEIMQFAKQFMKDPLFITIENEALVVPAIEQSYMETTEGTKTEALTSLIRKHKPRLSLVFCNTKHKVDEIATRLKRQGFRAEGLHGDMDQSRRDAVMNRFRSRSLSVLVATDVAARGLDISGVDLVFNYDVPKNAEHYVHRIGRTGRMGHAGKAITLVVLKEQKQIKRIQKHAQVVMGREMTEMKPTQTASQPLQATSRPRKAIPVSRPCSDKALPESPS
jgi:ATP-dependent RNA helicase DeaD